VIWRRVATWVLKKKAKNEPASGRRKVSREKGIKFLESFAYSGVLRSLRSFTETTRKLTTTRLGGKATLQLLQEVPSELTGTVFYTGGGAD